MKTKDEWLDDMELRLKRALLDVLDSSEDEGRRFLREEVTSHLEDVSSDRARFEYLVSLRERFPKLGGGEKEVVPEFPEPTVTTPEEAMEVVRENWEVLDEDTREMFLARIGACSARSSGSTGAGASGDPSDDLARFLKLGDETGIDLDRLQTACVSLLKTVAQVDSLGTQVYKQVGLSRDLKAEDVRKLVGDYVGGSVEIDSVNAVLDEARMKVGLIINSVAGLPSTLAQTHMAKFQPSVIEQSVGGSGGLLAGKDAKCWKKYVTLADDLQPAKVEKAVNDLMVRQLKKLKKR
jgi:hypothetical protein